MKRVLEIFLICLLPFLLREKNNSPRLLPAQAKIKRAPVIFHFTDIGGINTNNLFDLLVARLNYYRSRRRLPIIIGSGDYVHSPSLTTLTEFKRFIERFVTATNFPPQRIILALGNHDDPGRTATYLWNNVWQKSRRPEGVTKIGKTIIVWLHTEKTNLDLLAPKIARKRSLCPDCWGIVVGHKPIWVEPANPYPHYTLPVGTKEKLLSLMQQNNLTLYLSGHIEWHNTLRCQNILHNRATPARNGFEEIVDGKVYWVRGVDDIVGPLPETILPNCTLPTPLPVPTSIVPSSTPTLKPTPSPSCCRVTQKQEEGAQKIGLNQTWQQFIRFSFPAKTTLVKAYLKAGNYGGARRKLVCKITDDSGQAIGRETYSGSFTNSSGAAWRAINWGGIVLQPKTFYRLYCRGPDSWKSLYWLAHPAKGKTFRLCTR